MKLLFDEMKNDLFHTFLEGKILVLGFATASLLSFIKTYIFADLQYLIWLLIAMFLDIVSKLYRLWFIDKQKPSASILINRTAEKIIKYGIYLVISFVVVNFEVDGEKVKFLQNFNIFIYGILIVKEGISTLSNINMSFPKPLQDIIDSQFNLKKENETKTEN